MIEIIITIEGSAKAGKSAAAQVIARSMAQQGANVSLRDGEQGEIPVRSDLALGEILEGKSVLIKTAVTVKEAA